MHLRVFASASAIMGFLTASTVASAGSALVHNLCEYEIYMCNTPSTGGDYDEIRKTIQPGETYNQQWTILSTLQGLSIKLAPSAAKLQIQPMQYEYTYAGSATIWYDISNVNGDPFEGNWVMNSTNPSCKPRHMSYWESFDDQTSMQECNAQSDIALYICGNNTFASAVVADTS